MADVTIADMFVIGAGAGYGVFNNPRGPAIGFRAGVYPVHGVGADGIRRKGLVISFESRLAFLGDPNGTGVMLMGSIGYEAFSAFTLRAPAAGAAHLREWSRLSPGLAEVRGVSG